MLWIKSSFWMHQNLGTHPNDEDASFRLSEEQMFTAIFAYVEHLFGKIKPKKVDD